MLLSHRLALLAVFSLPVLSACGSSSHGSESGNSVLVGTGGTTTPTPPVTPPKATPVGGGGAPGDHNEVAATASVGAPFVVSVGASQTITVTFSSDDGSTLSAFSAYGSLGAYPAGWSSPNSLTCGTVGPGSGCVLTLIYTPTVVETGTLSLTCVFVDNAGLTRTPGPCLTLDYASARPNDVVASVSPAGEVDASVGAKQPVSISFSTDDGNAATALTVALGGLPAGWSSTAASVSCAVVSTGNGCQLPLVFAPASAGSGTLTLNYSYTDGSGAARSASFNIPYATPTNGAVVNSVAPSGEVTAAVAGGQSVAVNFNTVGGKTATGFGVLTDLSKLPPGWSSKSTVFTCNTVSAGNGCQLQLQYSPATLTTGTLNLRYQYTDANGNPNFGVLNIPYAATSDDNAVGTVAPSGQITAMLGAPSQPVSVTFTTDDARLGTSLQITGGLTALPPGWSSVAPTFGCAAFDIGSSCDLQLTYQPTGVDNGTLTLNYSYLNNANATKTGSVVIPYQTTTNDNVNGAVLPGSVTVASGSMASATVTFTTDDGNVASGLSADLSVLPSGWTAPAGSLTCASVSTGGACSVVLSYAPAAAASGTVAFGFDYSNSAGTAKTGTVSFMYTATP